MHQALETKLNAYHASKEIVVYVSPDQQNIGVAETVYTI